MEKRRYVHKSTGLQTVMYYLLDLNAKIYFPLREIAAIKERKEEPKGRHKNLIQKLLLSEIPFLCPFFCLNHQRVFGKHHTGVFFSQFDSYCRFHTRDVLNYHHPSMQTRNSTANFLHHQFGVVCGKCDHSSYFLFPSDKRDPCNTKWTLNMLHDRFRLSQPVWRN